MSEATHVLSMPPTWCWTSLGLLADSCMNGFGKRRQDKGTPTIVLRLADIQNREISLANPRFVNSSPEEVEKYKLLPDDLLAIRVNGSPDLIGRLSRFNSPDVVLFCDHFIRIRLLDSSMARFVRYYADTGFVRKHVEQNKVSSAGQNTITQGALERLEVPLPPISEQRRIVAKIEELFSDLDAGVAALQRARANLKRYKSSLLKEAVEGKLTKEWRNAHPDVEPASVLLERILAERRRRWEAEQLAKFSGVGRTLPKGWKDKYEEPECPNASLLPRPPDSWCWATVEQLASPLPRAIQSGPFGSNLLHSEFGPTGVLAIGIDNVLDGKFSVGSQNRISSEKFEQLKKYQARPLDVTITVMATVGRCCVVPIDIERAIITKHVYRVTTEERLVNPYYLSLCISGAPEVRKQIFGEVRGQTRPGINGAILKGVAIPLPPPLEQAAILSEIDRHLSIVAATEEYIETGLKKSGRLRQGILRDAFAGRLVPQDPNDEPASVLLQRIQQERQASVNGHVNHATNGRPRRKKA
jgi:type I restriction enzyme S subunit